jgi:hypothetical protein
MRLTKREPSGREKTPETLEMLAKLREKVYNENSSIARHSAFNLSWMQEDGFEILKEALCGNGTRTAKSAAAYGLRKMRGRMKKMAMDLLAEGLKHSNNDTRQVCAKALQLLKEPKQPAQPQSNYSPSRQQFRGPGPKFRISEIPPRRNQGFESRHGRRNPPQSPRYNR